MIKLATQSTMSISFNNWTESKEPSRGVIASSTQYELSDQVVLIQGRYVCGESGDKQLMVSVDPVAFERKLAIRELNAQLEGRNPKSQTFASTI
jgi:hypothetical protein